jgi:hypothetical protein
MTTFASALDSAEKLTLDEQEELALTLRRRVAERRRFEVIKAAAEAKQEFGKGQLKAASPVAIMKLIRR